MLGCSDGYGRSNAACPSPLLHRAGSMSCSATAAWSGGGSGARPGGDRPSSGKGQRVMRKSNSSSAHGMGTSSSSNMNGTRGSSISMENGLRGGIVGARNSNRSMEKLHRSSTSSGKESRNCSTGMAPDYDPRQLRLHCEVGAPGAGASDTLQHLQQREQDDRSLVAQALEISGAAAAGEERGCRDWGGRGGRGGGGGGGGGAEEESVRRMLEGKRILVSHWDLAQLDWSRDCATVDVGVGCISTADHV